MPITEPSIRPMSGNGFTTRVYNAGGVGRDKIRALLRRRYDAGTQMAFEYWENPRTTLTGLQHMANDFDLPGLKSVLDGIARRYFDM